jgi:hypothetical protein
MARASKRFTLHMVGAEASDGKRRPGQFLVLVLARQVRQFWSEEALVRITLNGRFLSTDDDQSAFTNRTSRAVWGAGTMAVPPQWQFDNGSYGRVPCYSMTQRAK